MFKFLIFPILFCLLVLCAGGAAPASAAEGTAARQGTFDLEDGFQGYPWGVSPENLEGFRKIGTKNNADFYICPCVTYLIEDITVPRVVYGFVDNQLYGVFIDIENDTAFDKLLAYITDTYGDPEVEKEAASLIVHRWSVGAVKIKLKDDLAAAFPEALQDGHEVRVTTRQDHGRVVPERLPARGGVAVSQHDGAVGGGRRGAAANAGKRLESLVPGRHHGGAAHLGTVLDHTIVFPGSVYQ